MIFVLMTTLNGADTLPETLDQLTHLVPPDGGWQMVVVDNGSDDGSREILGRYRHHLPLTIIGEARTGKNVALNRALDHLGGRAAKADLIVFCDDDILPEPDWLSRLAEAAKRHPSADMFGGTIYASWTSPVPEWVYDLERYHGTIFSVTRHEEGPCDARELFGPNMAIRGKVLRNGARFDPRFGPDGTNVYPMGSETEFVDRLEGVGHRAYFAADARVGHLVGQSQLTEDWVHLRAYRAGLGFALRNHQKRHKLKIAGIPLRLLLSLAKSYAITWTSRLAGRRDWVRLGQFRINWHRGVFHGIRAGHASPSVRSKKSGRLLAI
jgi:glycosyltransferase involved in cell wall biosynthesis